MALVKLQANIEEKLMDEIDVYAGMLHITRTAAVSVLLSRALQTEKMADSLTEFVNVYKTEKAEQENKK